MKHTVWTEGNRVFRACACLLICAITIVPPFVRAAGSLQIESHHSSALRLSRGYDGPVSKWKLSAPIAVTLRDIEGDESNANASHRASAFEIDVLTHHQGQDTPPEPLRGPPLN